MLNITIDAPRAFTPEQLIIVRTAFEKLSQITTMYKDAGLNGRMQDYVSISRDDLDLTDVIDDNGIPKIVNPSCTDEEFIRAIRLALHTIVTFEVTTETGTRFAASQLMPCIINTDRTVAWPEEPDFIIRLTEDDKITFELFNQLADIAAEGINPDCTKITMIVGGTTVWSM